MEEKADWLTDWPTDLMNYEAVYRTAPATPGLLNILYTELQLIGNLGTNNIGQFLV